MALPKPRGRGRPPEPKARYRRVADALRAQMRDGALKPGQNLPSLRRIAREMDVAQFTVRQAVEVLRAEGRIARNARRRLIVRSPYGAISTVGGVIVEVLGGNLHTYLKSGYVQALQRGIEFGAGDLMAPLLIVHDEHLRAHLPPDILDVPARGFVLVGQFQDAVLRKYERRSVPVVLADRPGADLHLHAVAVDNAPAAGDTVARLVALGHRRIAFLRFVQLSLRDIDPDSRERQKGFEAAARAAGLRPADRPVFNHFPNDGPDAPVFRAILDRRPRCTAVVCVDAGGAGRVAAAARARGWTVPRDLSIACFQPAEPAEERWAGPRADFFEMGRKAVRLLEHPLRTPCHERIPTAWHDGKTVGPAPKGTA